MMSTAPSTKRSWSVSSILKINVPSSCLEIKYAYKAVLKNQLETIKGISEKDILHKFFTSQNVDNIEVSKQVEILRNIGYSEEEIDVILTQVRGDEDYEELRDKAEQIILEWYLQNGGEEGFEPVNPYAI